jgi:hypothetical protein
MRQRTVLSLLAPVLLGLSAPAMAETEDKFQLNTTSDLVALCSAEPADPMMTAALNWCHGFVVGTYRILAMEEMKERHKSFCLPARAPNRSEAIAQFVTWAKASPPRLAQPPSDSILGFLESSFPCRSGK